MTNGMTWREVMRRQCSHTHIGDAGVCYQERVNMKASGGDTDSKQNTGDRHYMMLQGADASIKLYCPWVI